MLLHATLAEVVAVLREAAIDCLVLKGMALSQWAYAEPSQRPCSDIDLLVREPDWPRAAATLEALDFTACSQAGGAELFSGQAFVRRAAGAVATIDLHWAIASRPVLRHCLQFDELWGERQTLQTGAALSARHALLHAAMHRASLPPSERKRRRWVEDFQVLWRGLGEPERRDALALARERGIHALLVDALRSAGEDSEPPEEGEPSARLLQGQTPIQAWWFDLKCLRWKDRPGFVRDLVLPDSRYLREHFGGPLPLAWLRRTRASLLRLSSRRSS